jgi:hypothetical protein
MVMRRKRNEVQNNIYWNYNQEDLWGIHVECYIFYDSLERIKQGERINTSREKGKKFHSMMKNSRLKVSNTMNWEEVRDGKTSACWEPPIDTTQGKFLIDSAAKKQDGLPRGPLPPADMRAQWPACREALIALPILAQETFISAYSS